jgi:cytochrome c-type biogenesis protein CcmE
MTHRNIKIAITATVLSLAFAGLMWTTLAEGTEYYKHVDEVMAERAAWEGKRLQLHGFVVPNSIKVNPTTLEYRFQVHNNGSVLNATYKGIVPDTFTKEGAEVVMKGRLTPEGFHAETGGIMAKCPSKYEEAQQADPQSTIKKVG